MPNWKSQTFYVRTRSTFICLWRLHYEQSILICIYIYILISKSSTVAGPASVCRTAWTPARTPITIVPTAAPT